MHPTMPLSSTDDPSSILIVRVSAIGDVLMTSPVARALRTAYPHAHLTWVVDSLSAPLVRANPYVDEVIVVDIRQWERWLKAGQWGAFRRSFRAFRETLRSRTYDLAIDFQGLLKSGIITKMSRAPRRIGPLPSREGNRLLMTTHAPWPARPTHLAEKYLAMLAPLGIPAQNWQLVLEVPDGERAQAREFLASAGLHNERYVACCVASSRKNKDWVWSRWGELADELWRREGWRTVYVAGPECKSEAEALARQSASRAISSAGKTSLLQSAVIVQDAVAVVGVDTGLTYAGMAVGTPTVALYGSTDATWLTDEPHVAVCLHPMSCAPCGRHPKCAGFDCMRAISVQEVADALCTVLTDTLAPAGR